MVIAVVGALAVGALNVVIALVDEATGGMATIFLDNFTRMMEDKLAMFHQRLAEHIEQIHGGGEAVAPGRRVVEPQHQHQQHQHQHQQEQHQEQQPRSRHRAGKTRRGGVRPGEHLWLPDPSGKGKVSYIDYCLARAWKDCTVPCDSSAGAYQEGEVNGPEVSALPGGDGGAVEMSGLSGAREPLADHRSSSSTGRDEQTWTVPMAPPNTSGTGVFSHGTSTSTGTGTVTVTTQRPTRTMARNKTSLRTLEPEAYKANLKLKLNLRAGGGRPQSPKSGPGSAVDAAAVSDLPLHLLQGPGNPPWRPTPTDEPRMATATGGGPEEAMFMSISFMEEYKQKSHEELRLSDYLQNRRNSPNASLHPLALQDPRWREPPGVGEEDGRIVSVSNREEYAGKSHEEIRLEYYTQNRIRSSLGMGALPNLESSGLHLLQPTTASAYATTGDGGGGGGGGAATGGVEQGGSGGNYDGVASLAAALAAAMVEYKSDPAPAADESHFDATHLAAALSGGFHGLETGHATPHGYVGGSGAGGHGGGRASNLAVPDTSSPMEDEEDNESGENK